MKNILLIEDERILAKNISFFLSREGCQVDVAYDGESGWRDFIAKDYDLILLDWTLPKKDGLELCKEIRKKSNIPIIMLTAKSEILDRIIGLELGADDYVVKPFDQRELLARIHAVLRRNEQRVEDNFEQSWLQYDGLKLDRERLLILFRDKSISLTATEYKLLEILMKKPNNVFSRELIYEQVWDGQIEYSERTVDVTISRLRKKLLEISGKKYFHAVRGLGYRFGDNS